MSNMIGIFGSDLERLQKSLSFYEELYVKGEKIAFAKDGRRRHISDKCCS